MRQCKNCKWYRKWYRNFPHCYWGEFNSPICPYKPKWSSEMILKFLCILGIIILALIVIYIFCGCTQTIAYNIKPDGSFAYYKGNAFCNYQQFTDLAAYDSNSGIWLGRYEGNPQEIKAVMPYGIIETEGKTK